MQTITRITLLLASTISLTTTFISTAYAGDLYGAIAYSQAERVYGYSYNYNSRGEAETVALQNCLSRLSNDGSECSVELWFKNSYGALAQGDDGFGTGYGQYKQEAQLQALEKCQQYTTNCDIIETIGTD
ncbi:hypothetical protein BegalDRAFT_0977 [Beggiatoa alba B18LD]|uniref:DUF4189 domain-containing protein n=1 Tax=Beggiatoa alba B18LD TaxID=395493 RepID=I3CE38_9GAMM|nr:DUF4189 domain-containing protein [Beggiatoa alba]EIJ41881.1 hypothetical protein BegalDRAFT_0977 [Beggiatoa alba B18LD]